MSERMPVVFIAGPYRAGTVWQVQRNIREARERSLEVWLAGGCALCPHANTANFDGAAPDEVWLAGARELVRRSDAVLTLPGWEGSEGARAEVELARALLMPIFDNPNRDFHEWIQTWKERFSDATETRP